jgi:hypothetical protein
LFVIQLPFLAARQYLDKAYADELRTGRHPSGFDNPKAMLCLWRWSEDVYMEVLTIRAKQVQESSDAPLRAKALLSNGSKRFRSDCASGVGNCRHLGSGICPYGDYSLGLVALR